MEASPADGASGGVEGPLQKAMEMKAMVTRSRESRGIGREHEFHANATGLGSCCTSIGSYESYPMCLGKSYSWFITSKNSRCCSIWCTNLGRGCSIEVFQNKASQHTRNCCFRHV